MKKGFASILVNPYILIIFFFLLLLIFGWNHLLLSIIGDDYQYFDSFDVPITWTNGISDDGFYSWSGSVKPTHSDGSIYVTSSGHQRGTTFNVNKDFKGMDVKVKGRYSYGSRPNEGPTSWCGVGIMGMSPAIAQNIPFTAEIITSKINPDIIERIFNGKSYGTEDLGNNPLKLSFSANSWDVCGGSIYIDEIKFKPQFNCELPEDWGYDIYVAEELQSISHLQIEYETNNIIRRYCLSVPAIQIKLGTGVQGNAEILQQLALGKSITVPQGQRWMIFYITDYGRFDQTEIYNVVASCSYQDAAYDATLGRCTRPEPIPEPPIPTEDKPLYENTISGIREFTFTYNSINNEVMKIGNVIFAPSPNCGSDGVQFGSDFYTFSEGENTIIYPFNINYKKEKHISTSGREWCKKEYIFTFTNTNFIDVNFNEINNERYVNNLEYGNIIINNKFIEMDGFILNKYTKGLLFQERIEKIPVKINKGTNEYKFILDTSYLDEITYSTRLGFIIETPKERFSLVTNVDSYTYDIIPIPPILPVIIQCNSNADCNIPCEGITCKCIDNKLVYSGKCDVIIIEKQGILERFWNWIISLLSF